jgi:hypothetical protein
MIIACGVNRRPHAPSGPEREEKIDGKPDDDGGQPHQRVEHHDDHLAPGKTRQRESGAEWHADECGKQDRRKADNERQLHDGEQRRIARQQQLKRGNVVRQ